MLMGFFTSSINYLENAQLNGILPDIQLMLVLEAAMWLRLPPTPIEQIDKLRRHLARMFL